MSEYQRDNQSDETDELFRSGLQASVATAPEPPSLEEIAERMELTSVTPTGARRRGRNGARVLAIAAATAVALGLGAVVYQAASGDGGGTTEAQPTATSGADSGTDGEASDAAADSREAAADSEAAGAGDGTVEQTLERTGGELPLLLPVGDGWSVESAHQASGPFADPFADPQETLRVWRDPIEQYAGPELGVYTGARRDGQSPNGEPIELEGATVYEEHRANGSAITILGADDTVTVVYTFGLDHQAVLDVAAALVRDPDLPALELPTPPAFKQVVETTQVARETYSSLESSLQYDDDTGTRLFDLYLEEGSEFDFEDTVQSIRYSSSDVGQTSLFGVDVVVLRYEGDADDWVAVWYADGVVYRFRGEADNKDAFIDRLDDLRVVDRATFEAALPDDAVRTGETAAVVQEMLADVPLPAGFDVDAVVETAAGMTDRYQLGAHATGAVACTWIEQWIDGKATGDEAAVGEAVDAMATSHDWAVFGEMSAEGAWPAVVQEYADAIAGSGEIQAGTTLTVEESYQAALGCDS